MGDRSSEAQAWFEKALTVPEAERREFIESHCLDVELRELVVSWLARRSDAGPGFGDPTVSLSPGQSDVESLPTQQFTPEGTQLYTPAVARGKTSAGAEGQPTVVGPYVLSKVLGEGGMGTVYLAQQLKPVKRQVALKLIKADYHSKETIERFNAERQSLAMMEHPGIARVLDAGETERGTPYFAMEYVAGQPLTQYCDERRLKLRQRVELFLEICQALNHAHQKGIIHRDLKPSNILVMDVDGKPMAKIIDFGLAKAFDNPAGEAVALTMLGGVVGTLQYMSPEQADPSTRNVDTRADIYSLGTVLFELITGAPPLNRDLVKGSSTREILRKICELDAPLASSRLSTSNSTLDEIAQKRNVEPHRLMRMVKGDLDCIIAKMLEKSPEHRYGSVAMLIEDVTRFLEDRPILASPPSRRYRLLKMVRRNKLLVGVAAALALGLFFGLIGTTVGMVRARSAESVAKRAENTANIERKIAENALENERNARQQSEDTVAELFVERGQMALANSQPATAALWYASAAALPNRSQAQARVHKLQVKNSLRQSILPVAGFMPRTPVDRCEFSPTGRYIATSASNHPIYLFDWADRKDLSQSVDFGSVLAFCWHPLEDKLAVATADPPRLVIWSENECSQLKLASDIHPVTTMAFDLVGNRLAVAGKELAVIDVHTAEATSICSLRSSLSALSWNDANTQILGVDHQRLGWHFDLSKQQQGAVALQHNPHGDCPPVWNRNADSFYVTQYSQELQTMKLQKCRIQDGQIENLGEPVALPVPFVNKMQMTSDGRQLHIGGYRKMLTYDTNDFSKPLAEHEFLNQVLDVQAIGDGDVLGVGRSSEAVLARQRPGGSSVTRLPHFGIVIDCDSHVDGMHLATLQSDGALSIWRDARPIESLQLQPQWGFRPRVSKNQAMVVPGKWHESPMQRPALPTERLSFFDLTTGAHIRQDVDDGIIADCAINADASLAAVIAKIANNTILTLLDPRTGVRRHAPMPLTAESVSIDFSPRNNDLAILAVSGHAGVIDGESGQFKWIRNLSHWQLPANYGHSNHRIQFSPDGTAIVVVAPGFPGYLHTLDAVTGDLLYAEIPTVFKQEMLRSVAWSHDGRVLATVINGRNAVRFWDWRTGHELVPPIYHAGDAIGIFKACFSPDDKRILTANYDGFVRQFDWRTGQTAGPALEHPDEVFDVQFINADLAITACRDGAIRIWDLASGSMIAPAFLTTDDSENSGPVCLAVCDASQRCLITGATGQLYEVRLDEFLSQDVRDSADLATSLTVAQIASGNEIAAGKISRMDTRKWHERFNSAMHDLNRFNKSNRGDALKATMRAAEQLTLRGQSAQAIELLTSAYAKLAALSSTEPAKLIDHIQLLHQMSTICLEHSIEDRDCLDFLSAETEGLRQRLRDYDLQSRILQEIDLFRAGVAWLNMHRLPFQQLSPESVESLHGPKLEFDADGFIETRGTFAANDLYRIVLPLDRIPAALRLEVYPSELNPNRGIGGDAQGNFNLTRATLYAGRSQAHLVPMTNAVFSMWPTVETISRLNLPGLGSGWQARTQPRKPQHLTLFWDVGSDSGPQSKLLLELEFNGAVPRGMFRKFRLASCNAMNAEQWAVLDHLGRDATIDSRVALACAHILAEDYSAAREILTHIGSLPSSVTVAVPLLRACLASLEGADADAADALDKIFESTTSPLKQDAVYQVAINALRRIRQYDLMKADQLVSRYEQLKQLQALDRLIAKSPNTKYFRQSRADWYQARQMWGEAWKDLDEIRQLQPQDRLNWLIAAPALALSDPNRYPVYVEQAIDHFSKSKNAEEIETAIKIACLMPGAKNLEILDIDEIFRQMEAGATASYFPQYAYTAKAMLDYRLQKYDAALEAANKVSDDAHPIVKAQMIAVKALALLALGRNEQAELLLPEIDKLLPRVLAKQPPADFMTYVPLKQSEFAHDCLIAEIWRNELDKKLHR